MTDKQRAAMRAIIDNTAVQSAIYIKNYCAQHDCNSCIFSAQLHNVYTECRLGYKDPYGVTAPPEKWEVNNEILHSEIHEM